MLAVMLALGVLALVFGSEELEEAIADLQAQRLEQAERKLSKLLDRHPGSPEANFYLGILKFRTGRLSEAAPLLQKVVGLTPTHAGAWKALGAVYAAGGELRLAVVPFQKACELNPQEEDACYYLGRSLFGLNRYDAALPAFQKALHAAPEHSLWRVHRGLALVFDSLRRPEDAERHYVKAVQLNRGRAGPDEDPRIDLGIFLFRQGRTEESLRPLEEAVRASPSATRVRSQLGRSLLQLNQLETAIEHLEKAIQLDAEDWPTHLLLGKAYFRLGRIAEGERHTRTGEKGLAAEDYYGSSKVR
jgi:Flp pilus assembly protein TadD